LRHASSTSSLNNSKNSNFEVSFLSTTVIQLDKMSVYGLEVTFKLATGTLFRNETKVPYFENAE